MDCAHRLCFLPRGRSVLLSIAAVNFMHLLLVSLVVASMECSFIRRLCANVPIALTD